MKVTSKRPEPVKVGVTVELDAEEARILYDLCFFGTGSGGYQKTFDHYAKAYENKIESPTVVNNFLSSLLTGLQKNIGYLR